MVRQDLQDQQDILFSSSGKEELKDPAPSGMTSTTLPSAKRRLFPAIFRMAGNNPVNPVDPVG
jgi:hypothetical protein